ncbi:MAG TPA: hypothetical protein VG097_08850 [Gemmata sp.]|jgi:hypothetical protein|nr:hypothetical protein [Gemmata sp.]
MKMPKAGSNGHPQLETAMALLIQNQAQFVGQLAEFARERSENEQRHLEYERESKERFARIETQMAEVIRILTDHNRQIERLTEAVRDKIGFKS